MEGFLKRLMRRCCCCLHIRKRCRSFSSRALERVAGVRCSLDHRITMLSSGWFQCSTLNPAKAVTQEVSDTRTGRKIQIFSCFGRWYRYQSACHVIEISRRFHAFTALPAWPPFKAVPSFYCYYYHCQLPLVRLLRFPDDCLASEGISSHSQNESILQEGQHLHSPDHVSCKERLPPHLSESV